MTRRDRFRRRDYDDVWRPTQADLEAQERRRFSLAPGPKEALIEECLLCGFPSVGDLCRRCKEYQ